MLEKSINPDAKILIIGDSPSRADALGSRPFQAGEGQELNKMLHEAGIIRTDCHLTYVHHKAVSGWDAKAKYFARYTPTVQVAKPEIEASINRLPMIIEELKPNLIIALGELALWALTGEIGITKWRGSILQTNAGVKVIPTYAPDVVIRKWDWRFIAVQDLRRCAREAAFPGCVTPSYQFIIRPSFGEVMGTLDGILRRAHDGEKVLLAGDIETRAGHIACMGIGLDTLRAICIPFICVDNPEGYWPEEEEIQIVWMLIQLFRHPNIKWVFQNGIYDFQYFAVRWGAVPNIYMDTMLAQHTCFAGLPKGLDFQSSIYCEYHRYWKDEGKEFHTSIKTPDEEDKYWIYNCKDCVTTFEIAGVHEQNIEKLGQQGPYEFQMRQFMPVLRMMIRGVRCDKTRKNELAMELMDGLAEREQWLVDVVGHPLNVRSPKQMMAFFYDELGLPVQKVRKTGRPTANDEALHNLAKREPLISPVVDCISEMRSLGVFLSTFVKAPLGEDGRLRSSYNIAGTETFRWSSSKDAFGTGLNLQNIPKGTEK